MHELFKKRRSHRQFTEQEITDEQIYEILNAAMVAPSGNHLQPWEFVVVKDKESLRELSSVGDSQTFIGNAPIAIVICAKESDSKLWLEDCSIAAAHIYLESTNQGLATCWANIRNGLTSDGQDRESLVRDILNIPNDYRVLCMMPIGYPAQEIPEHSEKDFVEKKMHKEKW